MKKNGSKSPQTPTMTMGVLSGFIPEVIADLDRGQPPPALARGVVGEFIPQIADRDQRAPAPRVELGVVGEFIPQIADRDRRAPVPPVGLGVVAGFIPAMTVGVDLGNKKSALAFVNGAGELVAQKSIPTDKDSFAVTFSGVPVRIVLETGTHSAWVSRMLADMGHEVFVADSRKLKMIYENSRKTDENDAVILARLARADPTLLSPIQHKSLEHQFYWQQLRGRDAMVRSRTLIINSVRGLVKPFGNQFESTSSESFHKMEIPVEHRATTAPMMIAIESLTEQIKVCDQRIAQILKTNPMAQRLLQVPGVGPITTLAFIAAIGDPNRFKDPRSVGAYVGLVPRKDQSGDSDKDLPISKTGSPLLRRLLVSAAQYILGPFGPDCDLRRWGMAHGAVPNHAQDGKKGKKGNKKSKSARKRAVVAVARKLSVLLLRLLKTGEAYDPLRQARAKGTLEAHVIGTAESVIREAAIKPKRKPRAKKSVPKPNAPRTAPKAPASSDKLKPQTSNPTQRSRKTA